MRFVVAGAVFTALVACTGGGSPSSSSSGGACVPGDQKACACAGGTQGVQACKADGSGYEVCGQCGGGTSSSGGISGDTACTDVATAVCTRIAACSNYWLKAAYGDHAACVARARLAFSCPGVFSLDGATATPTQFEACATALQSTTCQDLIVAKWPTACQLAGTRPNGSGCGMAMQCQSGACNTTTASQCGTCAAMPQAGDTCTTDECDGGLTCVNGVCARYGSAGDTCDANHPCNPFLTCRSGTCGTPLAGGATCDPQASQCDAYGASLFCNAQRLCQVIDVVGAGSQCGYAAGATCTAMGTCRNGLCVSAAADGAACDVTNGPQCLWPATCAQGLCHLTDPAGCN